MPRIRNIKPEFWDSPSTARADLAVRLTFIAMWNWADDSGHGTANLKELEAFCFPNDDVQDLPRRGSGDSARNSGAVWPNFAEVLHEVSEAYGVIFYVVRGRHYYEIPSFKDHQAKHFRAQSKHPSVEEGQIVDIRSGNIIKPEGENTAVPEVRAQGAEIRLQDAEVREQGAEKNLLDRDRDVFDKNETPPKSLDELAARFAAEEKATGVYGTAAEPRCAKHKNDSNPPPCRACARARQWFESHQEAADAEARARRAEERRRADECPYCEGGWVKGTNPARRCDHKPPRKKPPF
uniref:Replisome organizer n=1 Tax=Corynebacterium phage HS01 TaxID=3056389 RepID=A0AA49X3T7_9VIRU|nr:MAG: replisome organizer [Corynebacterium phage HS01]